MLPQGGGGETKYSRYCIYSRYYIYMAKLKKKKQLIGLSEKAHDFKTWEHKNAVHNPLEISVPK